MVLLMCLSGEGKIISEKGKDSVDLTARLKEQGFDVVFTPGDMKKSGSKKIAALLAREHMSKGS